MLSRYCLCRLPELQHLKERLQAHGAFIAVFMSGVTAASALSSSVLPFEGVGLQLAGLCLIVLESVPLHMKAGM